MAFIVLLLLALVFALMLFIVFRFVRNVSDMIDNWEARRKKRMDEIVINLDQFNQLIIKFDQITGILLVGIGIFIASVIIFIMSIFISKG